jgi:hypothetical protein
MQGNISAKAGCSNGKKTHRPARSAALLQTACLHQDSGMSWTARMIVSGKYDPIKIKNPVSNLNCIRRVVLGSDSSHLNLCRLSSTAERTGLVIRGNCAYCCASTNPHSARLRSLVQLIQETDDMPTSHDISLQARTKARTCHRPGTGAITTTTRKTDDSRYCERRSKSDTKRRRSGIEPLSGRTLLCDV